MLSEPRGWNREAVRAAGQIFFAGILSGAFVAARVGFKPLLSPQCAVWVFITAMVVLSSTGDCLGQGVLKAFDRAGATLCGGLLGIAMSAVGRFLHLLGLPWLEQVYTVVGVATASALCGFLWLSYVAKVKWLRGHEYVYVLGVVTMGFVWLDAANTGDLLDEGLSRITAILIGDVIALLALVVIHPGSAISYVHMELVQCARHAGELVVKVCDLRIRHDNPELPLVAERIFNKDVDPIHQKYVNLLGKWHSLRTTLTYTNWEPSWLQPKNMQWAPPGAEKQYMLLIERITRMVITAMAIDTQLRGMRFQPQWDAAMQEAIRGFAEGAQALLLECASRLERAHRKGGPQSNPEKPEHLLAKLQASIEHLDKMARISVDTTEDVAQEFARAERPALLPGSSLLRISCGAAVEAAYVQRAGTSFVFLATQMGVQAIRFFEDVERLLEGRLSDGVPEQDISRENAGAPHSSHV